jgi:hypothetical protein
MQAATQFILDNFTRLKLLKAHDGATTEEVQDTAGTIYVRKILPCTGLPYQELTELRNTVLPTIYYTAEDADTTYVIEEYIGGRNLEEIRQALAAEHQYLTEGQIWSITNQICQALQVLHAHHILHRDIKPGNIILREDGSVKLIDFGAARLATAQEKGHDTLIMGTPGFAPPEQFGFAPTDVRSDLYALGMTMKALWAPSYHGPLLAIANRCTKFDPDQRINSAAEMAALLQNCVRSRWRRWQHGLIAGVLVVLILICAYAAHLNLAAPEAATNTASPLAPAASDTQPPSKKVPDAAKAAGSQTTAATADTRAPEPAAKTDTNPAATAAETATTSTDSDQAGAPAGGTTSVSLSSQSWNFSAGGAAAQGRVNLVSNMPPSIIVTNSGNAPLKNPTLDLYFSDFGVAGSNTEKTVDAGYPQRTQVQFLSNGGAAASHVRLRILGNIPVGKYAYLSPALAYPSYYKLGNAPAVRAVLHADNAADVENSYSINVR